MRGRPLCVALAIVVVIIMMFYSRFYGNQKEYDGEAKTFYCQVKEIQGQGENLSLIVQEVYEGDKKFCDCLKLYQKDGNSLFSSVKIGNIIEIYGSVYSFSKPGNPGQFNEEKYYREIGIDYKFFVQSLTIRKTQYHILQQKLYEVRKKACQYICDALPKQEAGIVAAMVFGEKSALTEDIKELYETGGISHILAISGLHISLLGGMLFVFLRKYIMPMQMAAVTCMSVLLLYGVLTGFSVSTKRAVIMMCCMLLARLLGRQYDTLSALALGALIQLIGTPLSLFQSGFLLSYGTVFGIQIFVQIFQDLSTSFPRLWKYISSSLGIFLVTLPIILYFYYEFSLYSVVVNSIVLPLCGMLLVGGVLASVALHFEFLLGRFLMGVVFYLLQFYEMVCSVISKFPYSVVIVGCPSVFQIVLYYLFLGIFAVRKKRGWILLLAFWCLVFPVSRTNSEFRITCLDVGQGDCNYIHYKDIDILIDGGSSDVSEVGKYRISSCLKYFGIRQLDYVFVTHSDSDHVNGIVEMITSDMGIEIEQVVLPEVVNRDKHYLELEDLLSQRCIDVKKMSRGECLAIGELELLCLHPYPDYKWESENDYSLVLQLNYRNFSGVFTGDLEEEGEQTILPLLEDVDFLKVGHHGSKGSSSEAFLQKLSPEIAVISAGANNTYGHPHKETLERLSEVGSKVYVTAQFGAVTVLVGEEVEVECWKSD